MVALRASAPPPWLRRMREAEAREAEFERLRGGSDRAGARKGRSWWLRHSAREETSFAWMSLALSIFLLAVTFVNSNRGEPHWTALSLVFLLGALSLTTGKHSLLVLLIERGIRTLGAEMSRFGTEPDPGVRESRTTVRYMAGWALCVSGIVALLIAMYLGLRSSTKDGASLWIAGSLAWLADAVWRFDIARRKRKLEEREAELERAPAVAV